MANDHKKSNRKSSAPASQSVKPVPPPLPAEASARISAAAAAAKPAPAPVKPAAPAPVKAVTPAPEPAKPAAPAVRRTEFSFDAPFAQGVTIAGDFNGWEMTTTPLQKSPDGIWRIQLDLKPGEYQYKFLVDGQWVNDPNNTRLVCNQFGSLNNVTEVR